jgi:multicomponent Na+:H+ antiporter subunit B
MRSTILSAAMKFILPLILLVSIFLLVRGHNEAGGGFVGGLVAAAGFVLVVIADGVEASLRLLRLEPKTIIGAGLLTACLSGLLPLAYQKPFLTGLWSPDDVPLMGGTGTPMLFDAGVYLVVLGIVTLLVSTLAEE